MDCDDLRLGGTLSGSGITGGTSINSTALYISDWSEVWGYVGLSGSVAEVAGRPGGYLAGDLLGRPRFLNLNLRVTRWGPSNGGLVEASEAEQLMANTDLFLSLLTTGVLLEVDMPDLTSRFLRVNPLDAFNFSQPLKMRDTSVPLVADYPYWQTGGAPDTDSISGADTVTTGGTAPVYNAVLVFAGDGTLTHADWTLEVVGSSSAVTVDLGARTVTQGGLPAPNLLRRSSRDFAWFDPGANSVTAAGTTVSVSWRDNWQ